jgi:glycosyltransferase involved in cell wall biosynthesis
MASGVPVVQPRRGAFVEVVGRTGGGVLVDQDNPDALASGLHSLWADPATRRRLGLTAYEGVRKHYTIAQSGDRLMAVYQSLTSGASKSSVAKGAVSKGTVLRDSA